MNCETFCDVVQDVARYEGLDSAVLREALAHAESCPGCDRRLEEAEALSAELRSLAAADGSRQAPARVESAVVAAFALSRNRSRRILQVRVATAASLIGVSALAFFAITLLRHARGENPPAPPPAIASPSRSNGSAAQPASLAEGEAGGNSVAAFEAQNGAADSFVPLTRTFDPAAADGDAVLRVALSRDELAGLGISTVSANGQRVLADMIVTSDGTPQAIRLVDGQ